MHRVVPEPVRDAELEANSAGAYLAERPCSRPYSDGKCYLATVTLMDPARMGAVIERRGFEYCMVHLLVPKQQSRLG